MKQIVFLFIFSFAAIITCVAQDYQEVVYLKNGSVIRGFIIEIIPCLLLSCQTFINVIRTAKAA